MGHEEIVPRTITSSEVIAGIKTELIARGADPTKIEIHYHAGAPATPSPPAHTDAPRRADKLVEYIVIMILGEIALGSLAVITILLVPAIMGLATIMTTFMIGFAIAVVAVAAAIRSLRYSKADVQMAKRR